MQIYAVFCTGDSAKYRVLIVVLEHSSVPFFCENINVVVVEMLMLILLTERKRFTFYECAYCLNTFIPLSLLPGSFSVS